MSMILVSKEMTNGRALVHYRVGGEKKGVRRYQYKDGSLTPEGYKHYKEMYGWGDQKKDEKKDTETTAAKDSRKPSLVDRFNSRIEKRHEKNKPETRKEEKASEKEIEEKVTEGMKTANQKIQDKAAERRQKQKELMDKILSIRSMPDDELNKNINRLQREKQLADLINERAAQDKGPLRQIMDKAFRQAVENLTKRSMDMIVDTMVNKAKTKLVGRKPEESGSKPDTSSTPSSGGKLSKDQKRQVRSLAASGKTAAELAVQFGVSESYINVLISSS